MTEKEVWEKIIVGSEEWCGLPDLGIPAIQARIDSGAKTSALHAVNIQPFLKGKEQWVRFEVHPIRTNRRVTTHSEAKITSRRGVRSSNGVLEKRFVINTTLKLGSANWPIELTLTDRDEMGLRMLIGREAMEQRILVDPGVRFHLGDLSETDLRRLYKPEPGGKKGLKIGLLASNPRLYSNQRIMKAGRERGHEMVFLNLKHCSMKLDAVTPEIHYRDGQLLDDFDAIVPRIRPAQTFYGTALTRQFQSMGVYCLNGPSAISQSRDKLYSLQLLLASGVDIPVTSFASSATDVSGLIALVGGPPLVIKLLQGTQGKGVILASTKKAAESVIGAFKSIRANILVQEFIKEAEGRDIRCFVIDKKVVASIERQADPDDFRSNLHQGGVASLVRISPDERRLAQKAARVFNLKVAGVDIIRSRKGPLILEVNSSPGLEGIEKTTGKDIAGLMIASIETKFDWKKS